MNEWSEPRRHCCRAGAVAWPDPCPWHPSGERTRFRAAEPHELDGPIRSEPEYGARQFLVGIFSGYAMGVLTAVSLGWWPF